MIGSLVDYITTDPPDGVLPCDGATYNRVDFPLLYASIDTMYIIDADTFQVPDLSGRARVSSGSGAGLSVRALGDTLGEETHVLTESELAAHHHSYDQIAATFIDPGVSPSVIGIDDINSANTGDTGGGAAHENMQPSYVVHTGVVAR